MSVLLHTAGYKQLHCPLRVLEKIIKKYLKQMCNYKVSIIWYLSTSLWFCISLERINDSNAWKCLVVIMFFVDRKVSVTEISALYC